VYHKQYTEERIRRCRERQREGDLVLPVVFATEDETPAQHVRRLPLDDAAATAEDLLVAMKFLPLSRELVRLRFPLLLNDSVVWRKGACHMGSGDLQRGFLK
jgi:hypothetical protein